MTTEHRTWPDQQDDCLMRPAEGRETELEREMSTEQEELSRGILRSDPHIRESLEQKIDRLEREKTLLHERVEELENPKLTHTKFGYKLIPDAKYESLKADALELKRLKDTDFAEFQKRIPIEWFIDITDLLGLPNTASLDQILEAVRDACGITREPLSQIKADAEKWRKAFISVMDMERIEQSIKDRELGALVRKIPEWKGLAKLPDGKWEYLKFDVADGWRSSTPDIDDTPEEALRAAGIE